MVANQVERRIDKMGRIVLPMDFRKALGLEGEAEVTLAIEGNTITVCGRERVCRLCGASAKLSDHLRVCAACIGRIKADCI